MQAVMRFAFGGEEQAAITDDLLEHRYAEGAPKLIALGRGEQRLAGAGQDDDGMSERGNLLAKQRFELKPSAGDGSRSEGGRSSIPALGEDADRPARPDPGLQHSGARSGWNGIGERGFAR